MHWTILVLGSLVTGFLLFGAVEWLRFKDVMTDEHGQTYQEKTRAANERLRDRVNRVKAAWSKDPDKKDLADKQAQEWADRRRFDQ